MRTLDITRPHFERGDRHHQEETKALKPEAAWRTGRWLYFRVRVAACLCEQTGQKCVDKLWEL